MSSVRDDHFDALYAASPDPWGVRESWYEERKRAVTLAALPDRRYTRAFEPGCGLGVLSEALAPRCDALICWESSERAAEATRETLAEHPNVSVAHAAVPELWPSGTFDLVVVSEVVYYLDAGDRARFWAGTLAGLAPGGVLLAVHWVHPSAEQDVDGETAHAEIRRLPGLEHLVGHRDTDFRLDVHRRREQS